MAKLKDTDKFIVQRNTNYYSVSYETIVGSVAVETATQGDAVSGVPGKMFPSNNFVYDKATGMLDIDIPTSLNFVGLVEESYVGPVAPTFTNGDFYLVNPDLNLEPSGVLTLYYADWTGLSPIEFYTLNVTTPGTGYRGQTGVVSVFGDGLETGCINLTRPEQGYGLSFSTRMVDGFIVVADTLIVNKGAGYEVDDIIELRSLEPTFLEPQSFVKVTGVDATDGSVLTFEFIQSEDNPVPVTEPTVGGYYLVPSVDESTQIGLRTQNRNSTIKGVNLFVDVTMQYGEVKSTTLSSISGHTGYKTNDQVFIYNPALGGFGDGVITIDINKDPSDRFNVAKGDKLIYNSMENFGALITKWILVKDSVSAATVTQITAPSRAYDDEWGNNNLAIELERSSSNTNEYLLSIRNANCVFDVNGDIDTFNSYSGLLTPEEKDKLTRVTRIGTVTGINTYSVSDNFTGAPYTPIDVVELDGDYRLSIRSAQIGRLGLTSISRITDVINTVSDYHENREEGTNVGGTSSQDVVMSANQSIETFCPNNFYALPAIS